MEDSKTVELDLTGCKYMMEMHQRIKDALELPDYYGCNWSAFHDMLRGEIDAQQIEIYGEHTLPVEWNEQLSALHEILAYVKSERLQSVEIFGFTIVD